jgi:(1->4)-alpha-D-glucan 1-alpha-D-glucosylmutase
MPRSGSCARLSSSTRWQQILDFVPNHMGVGGADNPLWLDVLEWGADAPHAGWFDIDWDPERRYLHNKILVPLLGDQYGIELERGMLRLQFDASEGSFAVWAYGTHKLPISPPHYARILGDGQLQLEQLADAFSWLPNWRQQMPQRAAEFKVQLAALVSERADVRAALQLALGRFEGRPGDSGSWRELDALIQQQHWRVAHFRVAADDINYRRFFNINDLAGLRTEVVEVFEHVHHRMLRLVKDGVIDGLRIDHIDGLFDPKAYLRRLQRRLTARRSGRHFYLVVEKILTPARTTARRLAGRWHHRLRLSQPGAGAADRCQRRIRLTDCYAEFTGEQRSFAEIARLCKLHIMDNEMASELNVLARDMARLARQNPAHRRLHPRSVAPGDQGADRLLSGVPHLHRQQRQAGRSRPALPELGAGAGAPQRDRDRPERLPLPGAGADRRPAAAATQRLLAPVAAALCDAAATVQRTGGRQGCGRHRLLSL